MIYCYDVYENFKGEESPRVRMNRANLEQDLRLKMVSEKEIADFFNDLERDSDYGTLYVRPNWTIDARAIPFKQFANDFTEEYCPFCENEVRIVVGIVSDCPECGHSLFPCSAYDCSEKCDWSNTTESCFMFQRNRKEIQNALQS
jgi:hypothetical protein